MKLGVLFILSLVPATLSKRVFDLGKIAEDYASELVKRGEGADSDQAPLFEAAQPAESLTPGEIYIPDGEEPQRGPTLLTSSLATSKKISLFASYVRDNVDISLKFNKKNEQFIVFAPTNEAVEALPLKPWQFPNTVDESKSPKEVDETIKANVDDYVESHVVDGQVPFSALEGSSKGVQLVSKNGKKIKLVNDDGEYYVNIEHDSWIHVDSIINADNGAILVINKSLSNPSI